MLFIFILLFQNFLMKYSITIITPFLISYFLGFHTSPKPRVRQTFPSENNGVNSSPKKFNLDLSSHFWVLFLKPVFQVLVIFVTPEFF